MDKHLQKSGRGTLIAALSVVSSLALAQSAGTAADATGSVADTTGTEGASARIQRGPATAAGSAAPGEQMAPAAQDAPLNAETQGFVGGSESPSATPATPASPATPATPASPTDSSDAAAVPTTPAPPPEVQGESVVTPPQGFVGGSETTTPAPAAPAATDSTATDSATIPAAPPPAPAGTEQPAASPEPQGFTGDSGTTAPAAADSTTNDSATIPAAPPPPPAGSEQPTADPNPQGFVGGGASPSGPGVGPGNAAPASTNLDTGDGIWETRPGNSVTTPSANPANVTQDD